MEILDRSSISVRGDGPPVVDAREHRFQLGAVGAAVIALSCLRVPKLIAVLAAVTALPVLPAIFRRWIAPRLEPPSAVQDARLPAFARIAGGAGLAAAAAGAMVAPSKLTYGALVGTGGLCLYGAASGVCVPCSTLLAFERAGLVTLDPPLVCSVRR